MYSINTASSTPTQIILPFFNPVHNRFIPQNLVHIFFFRGTYIGDLFIYLRAMCGEEVAEQLHKSTPEDIVQNDITKRFMENTDLCVIIAPSAISMDQLVVIFKNYH